MAIKSPAAMGYLMFVQGACLALVPSVRQRAEEYKSTANSNGRRVESKDSRRDRLLDESPSDKFENLPKWDHDFTLA